MRNYDTTSGLPYPRISRIEIDYAEDGTPRVEYVERMAIVDTGGSVRHIEASVTRHVLDLALISEPVQMVDPATGQAIPGQTTTVVQTMLALLAFLRADQLLRDEK